MNSCPQYCLQYFLYFEPIICFVQCNDNLFKRFATDQGSSLSNIYFLSENLPFTKLIPTLFKKKVLNILNFYRIKTIL